MIQWPAMQYNRAAPSNVNLGFWLGKPFQNSLQSVLWGCGADTQFVAVALLRGSQQEWKRHFTFTPLRSRLAFHSLRYFSAVSTIQTYFVYFYSSHDSMWSESHSELKLRWIKVNCYSVVAGLTGNKMFLQGSKLSFRQCYAHRDCAVLLHTAVG
jgi:hypothetical protein